VRSSLRNCITPCTWSLRPQFWIKHKYTFSPGLQNGLLDRDGCKYLFVTARLKQSQWNKSLTTKQSTSQLNWGQP
jgi:hypothetical protein